MSPFVMVGIACWDPGPAGEINAASIPASDGYLVPIPEQTKIMARASHQSHGRMAPLTPTGSPKNHALPKAATISGSRPKSLLTKAHRTQQVLQEKARNRLVNS
jgi:hypothetical protein